MDTQPAQPGPSRSKSSRLAGTLSNTSLIGTQQERRHQLLHRDAANAATKNMTHDTHLELVRKTGSSANQEQHAVGCEYLHTVVNGRQLTVYHAAGIHREQRDQFVAAYNGKPPWSAKAFVRTGHENERHDVVTSGIYTDKFPDKHPRE